jgi:hypothetical protein
MPDAAPANGAAGGAEPGVGLKTPGVNAPGFVAVGFVAVGFVPGGFVPGGFVPGGFVPGGFVPGGFVEVGPKPGTLGGSPEGVAGGNPRSPPGRVMLGSVEPISGLPVTFGPGASAGDEVASAPGAALGGAGAGVNPIASPEAWSPLAGPPGPAGFFSPGAV